MGYNTRTNTRKHSVIIVDAENVSKELFQYAFSYIKHRLFGDTSNLYIFGNKKNIPLKYYNKYKHATLVNTHIGKNLADTYICCFIAKMLYENDGITTFFLITQDRDMSCAIKLISDYGKCVVSITEKEHQISNIEKLGANMFYVERWLFDTTDERKVPINVCNSVDQYKYKNSLIKPWTTIYLRDKYVNRIYEIPFYNGMPIDKFEHSIPKDIIKKVKIRSIENTINCNELKCIDGKVYFKEEGEYYD